MTKMIRFFFLFIFLSLFINGNCQIMTIHHNGDSHSYKVQDIDSITMEEESISIDPLLQKKDTMRLLCIGNSYSLDGTICLPQLMVDMGISTKTFGIYCAMYAGASLEYWYNNLVNNDTIKYIYRMGGSITLSEKNRTLRDLLHEQWDVIVLQQYSDDSDKYETHVPYIGILKEVIQHECPNKDLVIAWHLTWSHASNFERGPYSEKGWEGIAECTNRITNNYGIKTIIPVGTAIQNARSCDLNDDMEITRGGSHLSYGVGHYIAGLAWFETLCRPIYGISCIGSIPSESMKRIDATKTPFYSITEENYLKCQECVSKAIEKPFSIAK